MKKVLALVVLVVSVAHANELEKAWNNFGKENRVIFGGKALLASSVGYTALRQLFLDGSFLCWLASKYWGLSWYQFTHDYFGYFANREHFQGSKMIEIVPRKVLMMGICTGVSYVAFKQAWLDAKKALGKGKKEEQPSQ